MIARSAENALFTPAGAAVLTRLSLKTVNGAITRQTIATVTRRGQPTRMLDLRGLISLVRERRLVDRFAPALRRDMFDARPATRRGTVSLEGGLLNIDLSQSGRELVQSLRDLRRARQLVVREPDIMRGDPVFCGTHVPVHDVAAQLAEGVTAAALHRSYPRLTSEMIQLAPIYAAAYPLRGRPRARPWRDRAPQHGKRGLVWPRSGPDDVPHRRLPNNGLDRVAGTPGSRRSHQGCSPIAKWFRAHCRSQDTRHEVAPHCRPTRRRTNPPPSAPLSRAGQCWLSRRSKAR